MKINNLTQISVGCKNYCLGIKNSITLIWQVVNVEEKILENGVELELIKERQKKKWYTAWSNHKKKTLIKEWEAGKMGMCFPIKEWEAADGLAHDR